MNLRIFTLGTASLVLGLVLAGCGKDVPGTDTPVSDGNTLTSQTRVAEVFSSTLDGYHGHDTLLVQITNDRLSLQGGGGTLPIVSGLALAEVAIGTYAGTRNLGGGVTETYAVTIDADGLVDGLSIERTGAGAGLLSAPVGVAPTIASGTDGVWTLGSTAALLAETSSNSTRMTIDAGGRLWWDLDGDPATTDDVVLIVLKADAGDLVGAATILYDWNADSTNDLVVLAVRLTISAGTLTRVQANADPVLAALDPANDWVDDASPFPTSVDVPRFGPWSAAMAGHWLAIPTARTNTIGGLVAVTRLETERTAIGGVTSTLVSATGDEAETVTIGYALDEKAGYPVVRMTVRTLVDRLGGGADETSRYAVYFARGSDGAVYRLGLWEDADDDGAIDAGEESVDAATAAIAFPASEPASNAAYPAAFTRWGIATAATHLRNQTFNAVTGHAALVGDLTPAAVATTPAPAGFVSVDGTGTSARLTAYWLPGEGISGLRWASGSRVVRRFMRAGGTYQQVERLVTPDYADLVP